MFSELLRDFGICCVASWAKLLPDANRLFQAQQQADQTAIEPMCNSCDQLDVLNGCIAQQRI